MWKIIIVAVLVSVSLLFVVFDEKWRAIGAGLLALYWLLIMAGVDLIEKPKSKKWWE